MDISNYFKYKQKYLEQKAGSIHIQITDQEDLSVTEISPELKRLLEKSTICLKEPTIHLLSVSQLTKSIVLKYISIIFVLGVISFLISIM